MSEKWQTKVYPRAKNMYGVATVRVTKNSIKVAFETEPENIYEVAVDKAPAEIKAGKWFVSMSADGQQLYSTAPVSGIFTCKFVKFACAEGSLPAPKHYTKSYVDSKGHEGVSEYDAFTALLEIVEGKDSGMKIPYFLRYNFAEVEGSVAFDKPRSKYTTQLQDFLDACGAFDKGKMTFTENILPALESRLKTANRKIMVIMKEGRIDSMAHLESEQE